MRTEKWRARFIRYYGSPERVRWMQAQPCLVCGAVPSEAHHVKTRAAGGGPDDVVPLCTAHHREFHDIGVRTFEDRHELDMDMYALVFSCRWKEREDDLAI